jgi:hypothetical protein
MSDQKDLIRGLESAIERAIGQLVTVRHSSVGSYVNLPIFYPSGAAASVLVTAEGSDFRVSDAGFAYREVELVGGETAFSRRAKRLVDDLGLHVSSRIIWAHATGTELAGAIADVGSTSAKLAAEIVSRIAGSPDVELAEHLQERLAKVFGSVNVDRDTTIPGASTRPWDVSAIVRLEDHRVIFDAVGNHALKVYSTATKFRDIALLDNAPRTVAVIRSVNEMGNLYNILAQAGHVLQEDASNAAFTRAAA